MKLSITQILSESWEDFKKLIINPIVLILFSASAAISLVPDFIQDDSSPLLLLMGIPLILLALFLYAYQLKLIYDIKTGAGRNMISEVLSIYLRYLWYTLIFIGIIIVTTLVVAVPAAVLYFMMDKPVWILFIAALIYIPAVIYLCIKLFFYAYLIIIEKDDTPLATSWAMTKPYFWALVLLFVILILIAVVAAVVISLLLTFTMNMQEKTIDIILLPLDIVVGIYMAVVFLNTFLFCRGQSKPQQVDTQTN